MRQQYKRGAKDYLASMEIGEVRKDNGAFNWRGMQTIACRLSEQYSCKWEFRTNQGGRYVTRIM